MKDAPMRAVTLSLEYDLHRRVLKFRMNGDDVSVSEWNFAQEDDRDATDLEARVGYAVLGALSALAGQSIGNRDYIQERNNRTVLILEQLKRRLEQGDGSAVVSMALELVASARRKRDETDISAAESLLHKAAQDGNSSAIEYLRSQWEVEKHDAIAAIREHGRRT